MIDDFIAVKLYNIQEYIDIHLYVMTVISYTFVQLTALLLKKKTEI